MRTAFVTLRTLSLVALTVFNFVRAAPLQHEAAVLDKRGFGVNDCSCKPSRDKPYPLVLVHATFFPEAHINWAYHSTRFLLRGYCVYQLNYGHVPQLPIGGMAKIEDSAAQLSEFIDKVLAAAGTTQVDILGHSQGGLMPLYYMKRMGGAAKVHKIGALAPATHGTSLSGIVELGRMVYDSAFLKDLYKDGDTSPGVQYFYLATKYDEFVTPYTRSFLRQTNANVTNAVIQDYCDKDLSEHVLLFANPLAFNIMENFFSPSPEPRTFDCLTLFSK
ncbi:unnamed protein product [Mortierella alpina]